MHDYSGPGSRDVFAPNVLNLSHAEGRVVSRYKDEAVGGTVATQNCKSVGDRGDAGENSFHLFSESFLRDTR